MGAVCIREYFPSTMKFLVLVLAFVAVSNAVPITGASTSEVPALELNPAPAAPPAAEAQAATQDIKDQALNQVLSFISEMAQPMSTEEHNALKDIIATGSEILMQAEKKAREMAKTPEVQNLVQTDSVTGMFGLKPDGTIDADAAATQMTEILASMASPENPLTAEEKNVLHDLITGFSRAFAPTKETTENLQKDFEKLVSGLGAPTANEKKDELAGATNLLSVFSEQKQAFDTKLLSDLTEKFLDSMEKQFAQVQQ
eukprot:c45348_g1_i1.p1 GENE.c45348_g1_i1~~c45348_g1_i1.p1  ORF type:complete len:257 (-),score=69.85 c45348_g1_i1:45-815(-)